MASARGCNGLEIVIDMEPVIGLNAGVFTLRTLAIVS
jgi:hypothetical protein